MKDITEQTLTINMFFSVLKEPYSTRYDIFSDGVYENKPTIC